MIPALRIVLERVTEPDIEPVTLAEAKVHLREYDTLATAKETQISALITAAREWAEDYTGRALIDQRWRLTVGDRAVTDSVSEPSCACQESEAKGTEIYLRKSPVLAIVSFVSVAADGTETAVDAADYELVEADSKWPRLVAQNGASWSGKQHRIVFRAGYADRDVSPAEDASEVPERFKQAVKLWVEAHYDRDERTMALLLETAEKILKAERVELGFA